MALSLERISARQERTALLSLLRVRRIVFQLRVTRALPSQVLSQRTHLIEEQSKPELVVRNIPLVVGACIRYLQLAELNAQAHGKPIQPIAGRADVELMPPQLVISCSRFQVIADIHVRRGNKMVEKLVEEAVTGVKVV